ncbi:hypothetical protein [Rossellomorea aquimaris]|uniref:hypothetical protein n=1 Tax=Rossellomorea aquimaris TaxID=189382 RepID=UPI0007D0743F|nr:hypothetical protein [Rossellomorea aquimaris]
MGVPLSDFTVLKYIADGMEQNPMRRESIEMELALDSLSDYSVYAFIIHDPLEHKDFHEYFVKEFANLHNSSGEHLVFFGLVDSPGALNLVGRKPFYQDIRDMVSSFEKTPNMEDGSYSVFALAHSLNISPEMLPAIIVTQDVRNSSFRYYKTCPNQIEKQMFKLTGVSYKMHTVKESSEHSVSEKQEMLYQMLDEQDLDLCKGMGDSQLTESIARALSDVLSFLVEGERDYNSIYVKKIAIRHRKDSIKRVIKELKGLRRKIKDLGHDDLEPQPEFQLLESIYIKLATFLNMVERKGSFDSEDAFPIKTEWLDGHSFKFLQTGLRVERFLGMRELNLDHSASAICFAKMFEREINSSLIHWVRKHLGIELPYYYYKYQPDKNAIVDINYTGNRRNGFSVDLNNNHYGKWTPPELGKSKKLAVSYINDDGWTSMGIGNKDIFLRNWQTIHRVRNKVAHTDEVGESEVKMMKDALVSLSTSNIFKELSSLKLKLRS